MKKIIAFLCFVSFVLGAYAQNINDYKYIIVPKKFNFLKQANQYQLNTLTKFLFEEAHFLAVYDDEQHPEDLQNVPCLGLKADVLNNSGVLATKVRLTLADCKNKIVFTSVEGKSREKDYKKGYHEALKSAFASIKTLNYRYQPQKPKEENKAEVVENTKGITPAMTLYAQPIANGFQLIDNTPKVMYIIQKTTVNDMYIIKDKNGILYQKDGHWIAEYYVNETFVTETIAIKF
jgi:hypothetical protein